MLARSIDGVSLVAEGDVPEGMRRLDEATAAATGGEMRDVELIAMTCCFMIFGCERARDFDRAAQWCLRVQEFCQRTGLRSIFGICRAHYGMVLTARGAWAEAEQEFLGTAQLLAARPGQAPDRVALCVPKTSSVSGDVRVFVDQATQPVPAKDTDGGRERR
jgi:hypothetical protein